MIPRLGDGNNFARLNETGYFDCGLENDSPSRGRKLESIVSLKDLRDSLENDSPSRGRKLNPHTMNNSPPRQCLENDSPSRGRKPQYLSCRLTNFLSLENDSPSRGRKQ